MRWHAFEIDWSLALSYRRRLRIALISAPSGRVGRRYARAYRRLASPRREGLARHARVTIVDYFAIFPWRLILSGRLRMPVMLAFLIRFTDFLDFAWFAPRYGLNTPSLAKGFCVLYILMLFLMMLIALIIAAIVRDGEDTFSAMSPIPTRMLTLIKKL